jgi:hypothetical protein
VEERYYSTHPYLGSRYKCVINFTIRPLCLRERTLYPVKLKILLNTLLLFKGLQLRITNQPTNQPTNPPTNQPTNQPACQPARLLNNKNRALLEKAINLVEKTQNIYGTLKCRTVFTYFPI